MTDNPNSPCGEEQEEQPLRRPGADLFEWLQVLIGCVLVAVLLFNCLIRLTRVVGESMDTTLENGEMMLIWSLGYQPEQGDIVVLNKTDSTTDQLLHSKAIVKRVIATGGQTVDIDYTTGSVYVDGELLDEPYLREEMTFPFDPMMQESHWEVPEHSIFVMGDNRNRSTDSRHQLVGPIDEDYVLGKVGFVLWPLDGFGSI